jgi:hypothetical protein
MPRKALASYDVYGTDTEKIQALRLGLDQVIYELIVVFAQDSDHIRTLCESSIEEAEEERGL